MDPKYLEELINQLLETGEILATRAFEISLRQVYVDAFQNFLASFVLLLVLVFAIYGTRKAYESSYRDPWDDFEGIGIILGTFSAVGFWFPLAAGIARLMNPEWYAIKMLLETFLK